MAFDVIQAEIGMLLGKLAEEPHDKAELETMLREKLNELKAFGMPLPQDLVDLEAALDGEMEDDEEERQREDGTPPEAKG